MMRRAPLGFALFTFAFALTAASPTRAADPKNVKEAEQRFKQGIRLMTAGKPDEARLQFAEANALVRSTDILWNLIGAEVQSGHDADALNHARQFVRDSKAPPADVRDALATVIPAAAAKVGQLEIDAPSGAQIEIDSKEKAGHAPLLDAYAVAPGHHKVVAITESERLTEDVDVAAGETRPVVLARPPLPVAPTISPQPEGTVVPSAPETSPVLASGELSESARKTRVWTSVGLGGAAVLMAAGGVAFFVAAQSSKDGATTLQSNIPAGGCPAAPGCADLSADLHRQNDEFRIGEGFPHAAGAASVAAVVSWVLLGHPHAQASASRFHVAPRVDHAGAGFLLQSSF